MNRLVIFIVLLCGLTSCGVQKINMSQDVKADSHEQTVDSTRLYRHIENLVRSQIDEILTRTTTTDLTIERKVLSPPDSSGCQHVMSEEKIMSLTTVTETIKSTTENMTETKEQRDSVSVSNAEADVIVDIQTDLEQKEGLPWWQKTLMIIGGCALAILIVKIAIRFL